MDNGTLRSFGSRSLRKTYVTIKRYNRNHVESNGFLSTCFLRIFNSEPCYILRQTFVNPHVVWSVNVYGYEKIFFVFLSYPFYVTWINVLYKVHMYVCIHYNTVYIQSYVKYLQNTYIKGHIYDQSYILNNGSHRQFFLQFGD